jgi:hypothetical protein
MGLYRLEYLLGELLEGRDGWLGWVDGILPMALSVVSPDGEGHDR